MDFEEVAVANGDVGRFRSGGDFPTREPRSRLGRCHARAHDTQEAAAAHFDVEFSAQPLRPLRLTFSDYRRGAEDAEATQRTRVS